MRLNDPSQLEEFLGPRVASYRFVPSPKPRKRLKGSLFLSASVWCLWLSDITHSLHTGLATSFSSREIWTKMPSSQLEFQNTYNSLLHEQDCDGYQSNLPADLTSQDDAVLLLMAIISDAIYLRQSLGRLVPTDNERRINNPFVPITPNTELERMQNLLSKGLDRWQSQFQELVSADVMAFYHYCRLYISCPVLPVLSPLSGYRNHSANLGFQRRSTTGNSIKISDQAVQQAWQVLDHAASRAKSDEQLCAVWLPIVVFHAGLVIWASIVLVGAERSERHGSKRALLAFKVELEGMPWPCCTEMAAVLHSLMTNV